MFMRGQNQSVEIKHEAAPSPTINQEINFEFFHSLATNNVEKVKFLLEKGEKIFPLLPAIPNFNIEQFLKDVIHNNENIKPYVEPINSLGILFTLIFVFKGDTQFPLIYQLARYEQVNILKFILAGTKEFGNRNKIADILQTLCKPIDVKIYNIFTATQTEQSHRDESTVHHFTLLHLAVLLNNERLVELLLQYGFKPTKSPGHLTGQRGFNDDITPLKLADYMLCRTDTGVPISQGIYSLLFKAGDRHAIGNIPLANIIGADYVEMLVLFIKLPEATYFPLVNLNAEDYDEMLNLLYKQPEDLKKINVNYKGDSDIYFDPLWCAAYDGKFEILKKLLTAGADPNSLPMEGKVVGPQQETALHAAIRKGHNNIAKLLVEEFKANINIPNQAGITPLHYAAYYKMNDILKFLCNQANIQLDQQDEFGNAAIHYAVLANNIEGINILKKMGADFTLTANLHCNEDWDENNEPNVTLTVFDCAILSGHYEMLQHLKREIGKPTFGMEIEEKAVTKLSMQKQRAAVHYLEKRFTDGFLGSGEIDESHKYFTQISISIGCLKDRLFSLWRIFNNNDQLNDYQCILEDAQATIGKTNFSSQRLKDLSFLDLLLAHQQDQQKRQLIISEITKLVFRPRDYDADKCVLSKNKLSTLRLLLAWSDPAQYDTVINNYLETANPLQYHHNLCLCEEGMHYLDDSLAIGLKENAALDRKVMDKLKCDYTTVRENEKFNAILPFMQTCKNPFTKVPLALTCAIMSFLRPDVSYKDADNQTQYIRTERWFKAFKANSQQSGTNAQSSSLNRDLADRTRFYEQFFSEKKSSPSTDSKSDAPSNNTQSPSNSNAPNNTANEGNKRRRK